MFKNQGNEVQFKQDANPQSNGGLQTAATDNFFQSKKPLNKRCHHFFGQILLKNYCSLQNFCHILSLKIISETSERHHLTPVSAAARNRGLPWGPGTKEGRELSSVQKGLLRQILCWRNVESRKGWYWRGEEWQPGLWQ